MRFLSSAVVVAGLVSLSGAHPAVVKDGTVPVVREAPGTRVRFKPAVRSGPVEERDHVSVTYPQGTVTGISLLEVESFRSIPFAQPPVGNLRLRPPVALAQSVGQVDGTGLLGPSCPQMIFSTDDSSVLLDILGDLVNFPPFEQLGNEQEDCLMLNVQRPAGTTADSKLPVLVWFFGGGFEFGSNAIYDGTAMINKGASISENIIFVAINSRVNGFGFLGGKALQDEGSTNLGLLDQRLGLEWVADNIAAFGGDPAKVTIWGESAGSISVLDQMLLFGGDNTYKGKPLFRGGIMNSGSIVPAEPTDGPKAQAIFDTVASRSGCGGLSDAGTLACLRAAPYATFQQAVNSVPSIVSYNSVALSYLPRPDGRVLTQSPDKLVLSGSYAPVPVIVGDQEDEGTIFAILPSNVTTSETLVAYLNSLYFQTATAQQMADFVATYPDDIAAGSPFRTSIFNELRPGFKRLAAILGDLVFTLTRRVFLSMANGQKPSVPTWSYLSSYDYGTPFLGTFHGSDLLQVFYGVAPDYASNAIQTYYINFIHNQDPNVGANSSLLNWPKWSENQNLMHFFNDHATLLKDDFRSDSYNYIANNIDAFYV